MMAWVKKFWSNHKTKTVGLLQVVGGTIILYQQNLEQFLSRKHYGVIIFGTGVVTAVIGYFNGKKNDPPQP